MQNTQQNMTTKHQTLL